MGDIFLEYIVKQKPTPKMILMRMGIIIGAIVLTFFMLMLSGNQIVATFLPALFCGMCFLVYKLFTGMSYEFEYIVTNGELDIDKIIARRSRKRVFNARPAEVEILAPLDEKYRHEYESGTFSKTIDAASSRTSDCRWFLIVNSDKHGRVRVIFEPTEKMVENMRLYMPKKVMLP